MSIETIIENAKRDGFGLSEDKQKEFEAKLAALSDEERAEFFMYMMDKLFRGIAPSNSQH